MRRIAWTLLGCLAVLTGSSPTAAGQAIGGDTHPLDPLTAGEITAAVTALKTSGKAGPSTRFPFVHLLEPPKEKVLAYQRGTSLPRRALIITYDWMKNRTAEAVVDVGRKEVVSWTEIPQAQPPFLPEDHQRTAEIVNLDRRWKDALAARGIADAGQVQVFGYPAGAYAPRPRSGNRIAVAIANAVWGSLEGLLAVVDLTEGRVLRVEDRPSKALPITAQTFDYERFTAPARQGLNPLRPAQARGPSFEVRGHEVRWQNWRFRFGFDGRVGVVLYTAGYEERGKLRPVLYRGCLSEMVVPYGDPDFLFWNPFDAGEFGLGTYAASPLTPVTDAPENATFFPATLHDSLGVPRQVPRAMALYERDGGVLWRHGADGRRARQLVLSWFATVDNYDYGFNWIFHQDGTLEVEVLLTGVMNIRPVERGSEGREAHAAKGAAGHLVAPNVEAPNHQHFFNFRLDMDVEGPGGNNLVELVSEALPDGPKNPNASGWVMREVPLLREKEARRTVDLATARRWKVSNPGVRNGLGQPVGYVLVPGENSLPFAAARSFLRQQAGFVDAHLWATPYQPRELHAAGDYVNGGAPGDGLPKWTAADRSLENTDLVLWYTLGVTHVPRPEDWPVMPVHRAGFKLVPAGFFDRNPALDVPRGEPPR
jgi:primary-amine oxidase